MKLAGSRRGHWRPGEKVGDQRRWWWELPIFRVRSTACVLSSQRVSTWRKDCAHGLGAKDVVLQEVDANNLDSDSRCRCRL